MALLSAVFGPLFSPKCFSLWSWLSKTIVSSIILASEDDHRELAVYGPAAWLDIPKCLMVIVSVKSKADRFSNLKRQA